MGKFLCKCDNTIRISGEIPNPQEWLFISDKEYNTYQNLIDAEKLYSSMRSFLKCDVCGRLWIFWDGFDKDPELYNKESY